MKKYTVVFLKTENYVLSYSINFDAKDLHHATKVIKEMSHQPYELYEMVLVD